VAASASTPTSLHITFPSVPLFGANQNPNAARCRLSSLSAAGPLSRRRGTQSLDGVNRTRRLGSGLKYTGDGTDANGKPLTAILAGRRGVSYKIAL